MLLAVTQPDNRRSIAVMEKLGMQYGGITPRCYGGRVLSLYTLKASGLRLAEAE